MIRQEIVCGAESVVVKGVEFGVLANELGCLLLLGSMNCRGGFCGIKLHCAKVILEALLSFTKANDFLQTVILLGHFIV